MDSLARRLFLITLWFTPLYLPLSVWAASSFGSIYVFSAWKEAIIAFLLVLLCKPILEVCNSPNKLIRWLNRSIVAYTVLYLLYVFVADSLFEFAAGFIFSTRFFFCFLIAQVAAKKLRITLPDITKIVVATGVVLSCAAIFQVFLLPPSFLTHLGYESIGQEIPGFPPAITPLGEVGDFIRPQATLRGPNPLGAFLILPLCLVALELLKQKGGGRKNVFYIVLMLTALGLTFSRSAWIGLVGSLGILAVVGLRSRLKRYALPVLLSLALAFVVGLVAINNKTGRLILLREDRVTSENLSDDIRFSLTKQAAADVLRHPLGHGPGNAGPVSTLEKSGEGKIAENYFLQVAQETGWLGLGLFLYANALLAKFMWSHRKETMALAVFASLIGLSVTNLMLHTWADEAVTIVWWSFAGIVAGTIVKEANKVYAKNRL